MAHSTTVTIYLHQTIFYLFYLIITSPVLLSINFLQHFNYHRLDEPSEFRVVYPSSRKTETMGPAETVAVQQPVRGAKTHLQANKSTTQIHKHHTNYHHVR